MMAIFNFFGSILGYLLWFLYNIFHNYGVAIIFFTIIIKAVLFPFSVKSQRSMASQTKLADKQKELQAKYGNNKQKYNEELMKLYEKEGVNPSSGCLTTLLPLPIMLGIYYSVIMPLSNTLHIASERIAEATDFINRIPGMVASATSGGIYSEMEIIRNFDALKDHLTMFTPEDLDKIESFTQGFHFLGLDLLATPQSGGFLDFLWVIPALSLISSFGYRDVYVPLPEGPQRADTAWLHEGHDVFPPLNQRVLGLDHAQRRGPVLGDFFRHQFLAEPDYQQVFQH